MFTISPSIFVALWAISSILTCRAFTSYANEFVNPNYMLARKYPGNTGGAQFSILKWADQLAVQGPWTVIDKPVVPPSGDIHDYMSWSPYSWPNCAALGNTSELPLPEVWSTCPYYLRDGIFNPDVRMINNTGHFNAMADAVWMNALAWSMTGIPRYSINAANFINIWFIQNSTAMNPNLVYSQMRRGPGKGQLGAHTGELDLKCMAKVANAILILRNGNSPHWTQELDAGMVDWCNRFISWFTSYWIALEEAIAKNNHGSFYYSQLASHQMIAHDYDGARATIRTYFSTIYMNQITSTGEQPLEARRTRPYHYRAYNVIAMMTNARIGSYLGLDYWNYTGAEGAGIQDALDFAMTIPPTDDPLGHRQPAELYQPVAGVASQYGDPDGKYASFLSQIDQRYPSAPYFLWCQPFSESGLVAARPGYSPSRDVASEARAPLAAVLCIAVLLGICLS
ncbi:chondroitin AC/alginate lyase [Hygrophoropsis aurantiaca]|uniref:Chondroitin AC/alginate lyase n=1 Tax=Hygrophoropsis aurantiaca TaxID=72124 RepID=A0ACB8ASK5_9AGAM|nr:chondroitin AC/alginate lyase [Hygrophoropsis aurantiaca]